MWIRGTYRFQSLLRILRRKHLADDQRWLERRWHSLPLSGGSSDRREGAVVSAYRPSRWMHEWRTAGRISWKAHQGSVKIFNISIFIIYIYFFYFNKLFFIYVFIFYLCIYLIKLLIIFIFIYLLPWTCHQRTNAWPSWGGSVDIRWRTQSGGGHPVLHLRPESCRRRWKRCRSAT